MQEKKFWLGGKQNVISNLNNGLVIDVMIDKQRKDSKKYQSKKIRYVNSKEINKVFNNSNDYKHQGFAAKIIYKGIINLDDFFKSGENNLIFLDDLHDIGNIGTIIRTCVSFDIKTIILNKNKLNFNLSLLFKNSAGSFPKVKLIYVSNINKYLKLFSNNNFKIIGLDSNSKNKLSDHAWDEKNLLLFGSEDKGIKKNLLFNCTKKISIKTTNNIESLNVAQACSITLYDLRTRSKYF